MSSPRDRSFVRVHLSLLATLSATFLLALGCGGGSPAGSGSGGRGGSTSSGNGGSTSSGNGGSTSSGNGGSTSSGNGGSTSSGNGGSTSSGNGGSTSSGNGGSTTSGNAGTTGATGTGGSGTTIGSTQCSDGIDNDADGKIDFVDPECVGPNDNDESSFATGIPGDNKDPCMQDCFFDGNSGAGDDKCDWQLKCDPASTNAKCPYDANYATQHAMECSLSASQSPACISNCRKFVPNGCDCFGCCAVPGGLTILLAPTCTAADFNDPTKCPRCTQVTQCSNPCDRCEICIGKPTIPADCGGSDGGVPDGGTPVPVCNDSDFNITCGPGGSVPATGCPTGLGCLTGCCQPLP